MKSTSKVLLLASSLLLLVYPLWGVFSPESFATELTQHHQHGEGYGMQQVVASAAGLWIPNGILALSFILIFLFIRNPENTNFGVSGGLFLVLYPFARTLTEVLIGKIMLASGVSMEISSEKLFYMVFGVVVIAMVQQYSELNKKRNGVDGSIEQPFG